MAERRTSPVRVLDPGGPTPHGSPPRRGASGGLVAGLVAVAAVAGLLAGSSFGADPATTDPPPSTVAAPATTPPAPGEPEPAIPSATAFLAAVAPPTRADAATEWVDPNHLLAATFDATGIAYTASPAGVTRWNSDGTSDPIGGPDTPLGIFDLAVAPAGDLWAATTDGVARWDGGQWQTRRLTDDPRGGPSWRSPVVDAGGDVWLTRSSYSEDGRDDRHEVLRIDETGPRATVYRFPGTVRTLDTAPDGTVWALADGRVWHTDGDDWVGPLTGATLVEEMSIGPDGALWLAVGSSVRRYPGDVEALSFTDSTLMYSSDGADGWLFGLTVGAAGEAWVFEERFDDGDRSLHVISIDGEWETELSHDFWPWQAVPTPDGDVLVRTGSGAVRIGEESIVDAFRQDGPAIPWSTSLAIDESGAVLLGQRDQVTRFDGTRWSIAVSGFDIGVIMPDRPRDLSVASRPGVATYLTAGCRVWIEVGDDRRRIPEPTDLAEQQSCWASSAVVGPDGALWLITFTDTGAVELWKVDESGWTSTAPPNGLTHRSRLAVADDGTLWVTGDGLARLDDAWSTVLAGVDTGAVAVVGDGVVVAEECPDCDEEHTPRLWHYRDGTLTAETRMTAVEAIAPSPDGGLWLVGTGRDGRRGLWRTNARGAPTLVASGPRLHLLAVATDGSAWAAGPGRLVHAEP